MSELLYADTTSVAETIERVVADTDYSDDDVCVFVYESDATMRGITPDERRERGLSDEGESVCELRYDGTELTLHVHESQMESDFTLSPHGLTYGLGSQATQPDELAPALVPVIAGLNSEFDVASYDFTGVEAASIASAGHYTDFEFEYVVTSTDFF